MLCYLQIISFDSYFYSRFYRAGTWGLKRLVSSLLGSSKTWISKPILLALSLHHLLYNISLGFIMQQWVLWSWIRHFPHILLMPVRNYNSVNTNQVLFVSEASPHPPSPSSMSITERVSFCCPQFTRSNSECWLGNLIPKIWCSSVPSGDTDTKEI